MRVEEDFPRSVTEHADWGIVMSDGCRLSARIWMPDDADENPVPVILEHLPYRKRDGTIVRDQFTHPWFAGHGYCCIRTDMRGSGESEGLLDDEYTEQELRDACEVIAWAAAQPWCNGNVGMMGISWGGFNGLQVAALNPPALKAVITLCSTVDRYADDIHYMGGCLLLENFGWSSNIMSYASRPPDPALVGDKWQDMWRARLENEKLQWSNWFRHQHRDAYWKHGSVCEDYSTITASVLSIGGWHDGYRNTISHLVENLSAPVKGIVGPWNHKYPHYAGPQPAIGFLQEAKRWWGRWLKDEDTGVENDPDYRVWLMDSLKPKRWFDKRPGRWVAEKNWPSPNVQKQSYFLTEQGLSENQSSIGEAKISSLQHCGSTSGEYFPFAFGDELPDEQSADDMHSLCFDGEFLDETIEIVGAPEVRFTLSVDKPSALMAVRLCDLRPDGTSAHISSGFLNLTHRDSHETPTAVKPGEEFEVTIHLDQTAYRLPEGHKLRLAISTSCWPFVWPSPEQVELALHDGRLDLPVRDGGHENECHFEEPVGAPAWKAENLRNTSYSRETKTDPDTGIVTTTIHCDNGENRDLNHGLVSGSWFREEFLIHPDDPLSARATAEWEQTGGRENQMWRTHVETEMWSDQTHFFTTAKLRTYVEGALFFEREYQDNVLRNLV